MIFFIKIFNFPTAFGYNIKLTMQIIDPLSCGFTKVFCYQMFADRKWTNRSNNAKHQQSEILREQFDSFKSQFTSDTFKVPYSQLKITFGK